MSQINELPLYIAAYKLQKYLYLVTKHFPKEYKYTLGTSIIERSWETLDSITQANILPNMEKTPVILKASVAFDQLKFRLRMAHELKLIPHKKYAFIILQNEEIGKMLNGWLKWARLAESKRAEKIA